MKNLPAPTGDMAMKTFVDNVITTGSTLQACHDAMGWGDGLAYADAIHVCINKATSV